jgi:hypothetical protein
MEKDKFDFEAFIQKIPKSRFFFGPIYPEILVKAYISNQIVLDQTYPNIIRNHRQSTIGHNTIHAKTQYECMLGYDKRERMKCFYLFYTVHEYHNFIILDKKKDVKELKMKLLYKVLLCDRIKWLIGGHAKSDQIKKYVKFSFWEDSKISAEDLSVLFKIDQMIDSDTSSHSQIYGKNTWFEKEKQVTITLVSHLENIGVVNNHKKNYFDWYSKAATREYMNKYQLYVQSYMDSVFEESILNKSYNSYPIIFLCKNEDITYEMPHYVINRVSHLAELIAKSNNIEVQNFDANTVKIFLKYIYTGRLDIPDDPKLFFEMCDLFDYFGLVFDSLRNLHQTISDNYDRVISI